MEIIEARYRIATPMFLDGSARRGDGLATLRLASLKGALRFWWRARAWARLQDLDALRRREAELFGGPRQGRAALLWRVREDETSPPAEPAGREIGQEGCFDLDEGGCYLAHGVLRRIPAKRRREEDRYILRRSYLPAGMAFTIQAARPAQLADEDLEEILDAMRMLGTLGGLGSRNRRGFGSVVLERLSLGGESLWEAPEDAEALAEAVEGLVGQACQAGTSGSLTAFHQGAQVAVLPGDEQEGPLELLCRFGREMVRYRSWGRGSRILESGERAERNFRRDYALVKRSLGGRRISVAPERIGFGLPMQHYLSSMRDGCEVRPAIHERRASGMLVHVHQGGLRGASALVVCLLPGQFLPEDEALSICESLVPWQTAEVWQAPAAFLERLVDPEAGRERFEGARLL